MRACIRSAVLFWVGSAMLVGAGSGCATAREKLELSNEALVREVARLKADKANLQARAAALEDETLVLERKAQQCAAPSRPVLPVVRVEAGESPGVPELGPGTEEVKVTSGERPLLSLGPGAAAARRRSTSIDSVENTGRDELMFGQADSLGVTSGAPAAAPTEMEQFNQGYRLYANREYREALSVLGDFASRAPTHDYADDALFWRAECYSAMGKHFRAIGELERLVSRYPGSSKVGAALWRIGNAYDKLGDSTKALGFYFRVVEEFPSTDVARKASQRVAALSGSSAASSTLRPTSHEVRR